MTHNESLLTFLKENSDLSQKEIDSLFNTNKSLEDVFLKCGVVECIDNAFSFTRLGYWLFKTTKFSTISFFNNSYLHVFNKNIPFIELDKTFSLFSYYLPKYEDRSNIIREEKQEIDSKLLSSVIASAIASTNLYSNNIIIEQNDNDMSITISCVHDNSNREDSLNIVRLFSFLGKIDWHYQKIIKDYENLGFVNKTRTKNKIIFNIVYVTNRFRYRVDNQFTNSEKLVLEYALKHSNFSRKDIVNLGISSRNASRLLNILTNKKMLKRIGIKGSRSSSYSIKVS